MLPTFFVLGAMKAGTTGMFRHLAQHPGVFMPVRKEPQFFCEREDADWGGPDRRRRPRLSLAEYEALFAGARPAQARGEATPTYLCDPVALGRIRDAVPDAKVIVSLRQPVDRAYSAWLMKRRQGLETLGFEEALADEPRRIAAGWRFSWHYAALGRYRAQLEACSATFAPAQIKVILFDDLTRDTAGVLRDIFRFLGVDETFPVDLSVPVNSAHLTKVPAVARWMISPSRVRIAARRWVPRLAAPLWGAIKRANDTFNAMPAPRLSPEIRARLTREWDAEILAVQSFLGRDLSAWRQS